MKMGLNTKIPYQTNLISLKLKKKSDIKLFAFLFHISNAEMPCSLQMFRIQFILLIVDFSSLWESCPLDVSSTEVYGAPVSLDPSQFKSHRTPERRGKRQKVAITKSPGIHGIVA
jgi:hypothetical protein